MSRLLPRAISLVQALPRRSSHVPRARTAAIVASAVIASVGAGAFSRVVCEDKKPAQGQQQQSQQQEDSSASSSLVAGLSSLGSDQLLSTLGQGASTLTFGGIMGFCSGVMIKKVGKVLIVLTGGVFAMFQLAANSGYVQVNWDKVKQDFELTLDQNGDGKLDGEDAKIALSKVTHVLTNNMATTGAGFTGGFIYGLKKG
eukprot:c10256_g1_i1.p1 GENE.c10256_g1_i1~~c10256_g1_i1.p1  ORF type:complete len:200 (-),score=30.37 c10256_g1_i1:24-623(-)